MTVSIVHGDSFAFMRGSPGCAYDAIVTDPPYGISFVGKEWDHSTPVAHFWGEALWVAKPGAWLAAFGSPRTFHRLAAAIEDAGWELYDTLCWLHGQGFPKTAKVHLKPAWEPIVLARRPLLVGSVEDNVRAFGTGGLNVDDCRIPAAGRPAIERVAHKIKTVYGGGVNYGSRAAGATDRGRWPADVILSHVAPDEGGARGCRRVGVRGVRSGVSGPRSGHSFGSDGLYVGSAGKGEEKGTSRGCGPVEEVEAWECVDGCPVRLLDEDSGGASRFFYTAKASRADRGHGNTHPTVKPLRLMEWLVRLVTPPDGTILDPFAGSGTTLLAARNLGYSAVGVEKEAEYVVVARRRLGLPDEGEEVAFSVG